MPSCRGKATAGADPSRLGGCCGRLSTVRRVGLYSFGNWLEAAIAEHAAVQAGPVLTTRKVVFLVIAAAAPMAAMVGNVPLALVYGNGAGLPAAFLLATFVLICFSVGYAAMSRRVINTGAFYTYIALSLTKPVGVGSAYVALAAYTAQACGLAGAFGYFMQQLVLEGAGVDLPWYLFTAVGIFVVAILGYRSVEMSAKVIGFFMIAEFAVLLVFEALVINERHFSAFPMESFSRAQVSSGPIGIAMLFAFTSFIGFESAALYGEETKDPERSIPRATYIAVSSVGVFYILSSWIIVGAVGADKVRALSEKDGGVFVINLVQQFGGTALFDVTAVLLCTSVLAGYSAIHNAASRYLFALGRESIMPTHFGRHHRSFSSPHRASLAITGVAVLSALFFFGIGADPYTVYAASLIAVGTLGIVALQAMASLSVIAFFWNRPDRQIWQGVIAPLIGFVGLVSAFVLAAMHYNTLTGSDSQAVNLVPFGLLAIAIGGTFFGIDLKTRRPEVYAGLAVSKLRNR